MAQVERCVLGRVQGFFAQFARDLETILLVQDRCLFKQKLMNVLVSAGSATCAVNAGLFLVFNRLDSQVNHLLKGCEILISPKTIFGCALSLDLA